MINFFQKKFKYMILLNIFVRKTFLPVLDHFFGRHILWNEFAGF